MNRQEVLSLIKRMSTTESILVGESGADKDSWKAYREAEESNDEGLTPVLVELINENVFNGRELSALYHLLIYNCYNLNLGWKTVFDSLPDNPDREIVQGILLQVMNINRTPKYRSWPVEDEKAVLMMLEYSRLAYSWERSRAWGALGFVSVLQKEVEKRAIEALKNYDESENEENKFLEAEQILDVIARIGTKESLPILKATMEVYKGKQWISVAAGTIGEIGREQEEEYLLGQLELQRNGFVKSMIGFQLTKYGSEKSIPALIDKVKKLLGKNRKIDGYFMDNHWFELIDLLTFLKKYESQADIVKLFKWIVTKNLDKLAPKELAWVKENLNLME